MNSSSSRSRLAESVARVMYTNAVYFPNHRIYQGESPGMLNYACINQVYYAYANVSDNGGVFLSDEWADAQAPVDGVKGGLGSLMHLKYQHPHLQVLLSIGGPNATETLALVAGNTIFRDNFGRSALGLVEASGLDGIDISWQYPSTPQQGADFIALLAAVRVHLPEDRFGLTAALPANESALQHIDLAAAAGYLDFINLVTYDFYGPWSPTSGHHAQLYAMSRTEPSGSSGVSCLISKQVPPKKILLGIPTIGRSFLSASRPGQPFTGCGGQDGTFEYNQLPRSECTEVTDKRRVAAQCVGGDGGFVTYDNPESVRSKAEFCKIKGLGGFFYSNGAADSRDMARSLIAAGFRALHSL